MTEHGKKDRIIAIGDIHGCSTALDAILRLVEPGPGDTVVTLGDYVDRGPDSKGVLDLLLRLKSRCHLVPLMGNHEEMMLGAREGRSDLRFWLTPTCGGLTTLQSYGPAQDVSLIPREHWAFLASLPLYYEADGHFFVHANYAPNQHFRDQVSQTLLWLDLSDLPGPHFSRKVAVVGHTPQNDGNILRLDHLVCIDTGCGHGGLLTALDVASGRIWQVTEDGQQV